MHYKWHFLKLQDMSFSILWDSGRTHKAPLCHIPKNLRKYKERARILCNFPQDNFEKSQYKTKIIPIEVKAGHKRRFKSLRIFMKEKCSPLGVVISQRPLAFEDNILYLPFYLISELPRILESVLSK